MQRMKALRSISLTVVEPKAGWFFWQLLEASPEEGTGWMELQKSARAYREWIEAFNDGIDQVFTLTGDGRYGPR